MVLNSDDKIHVIIRRRFDTDLRRHFIGEVNDATETVVRVSGYVFVLDTKTNLFVRRLQLRTRIVSLVDAGNIINVLPREADIEKAGYSLSKENRLVVTDGKTFSLDINEFGTER